MRPTAAIDDGRGTIQANSRRRPRSAIDDVHKDAFRKGFDEGREEGYKEGKAEVERLYRAPPHDHRAGPGQARRRYWRRPRRRSWSWCSSWPGRSSRSSPKTRRTWSSQNIVQALRKLQTRSEVTIRVNLADLQLASEHTKDFVAMAENAKHIQIVEDTTIDRGGCIIETDFGEIDARISEPAPRTGGEDSGHFPHQGPRKAAGLGLGHGKPVEVSDRHRPDGSHQVHGTRDQGAGPPRGEPRPPGRDRRGLQDSHTEDRTAPPWRRSWGCGTRPSS